MKQLSYYSALTIAGFDGSGGAGIQADIKTFSALGCYATSVLTALPVQNTQGVRNIYPIPVEAVTEQLECILDDIQPSAIKIGMVHTSALVEAITVILRKYPAIPIVFDPVMVATSGHRLIQEETISAIIDQLFPIATIITPNMDEAAILANREVKTLEDMETAGELIRSLGCRAILMKGGHQQTSIITSVLFDVSGARHTFESAKINTNNTHGSGCTLSSAIAAYLARGKNVLEAVTLGQEYVYEAIKNGSEVKTGKGNGPLNHFFNPQSQLTHYEMV